MVRQVPSPRALVVGALALTLALVASCSSDPRADDRDVSLPDRTAPTTTTLGPRIAYTPSFQPGACPSEIPAPDVLGLSCGHLTVPENRHDANDGNVVLTVVVVHANTSSPAPDPVVYLDGGPGGSALGLLGYWIDSPIRNQRDIVVVGQRGTKYSAPTLDCPESRRLVFPQMSEPSDSQSVIDAQLGATRQCRDRLDGEGIPLSVYNTDENAADIADLRVAMGYESWNLLGISYGTRLALEVMRDYPEGIRSVVLDSTYPTGIDASAELIPNAQRAIDALFDACEASSCAQRYPDLRNRFYALLDRLEAEPQQSTVSGGAAASTDVTILWDADRVVRFLFSALYDAAAIAELPYFIQAFENNDFAEISEYFADVNIEAAQSFSDGMFRSVQCRERLGLTDQAAIDARAVDVNPHVARAMGMGPELADCEAWNVQPAPAGANDPVTSDIPTLVLAGVFDPITPPSWGELAASTLPNATYVLVPGIGHGATPEPCPNQLIVAFLAAPGPVASNCGGAPDWR
jgi:pimeloyl-ACP methyl ester carboxylesterase